jgi:hypothetical protein
MLSQPAQLAQATAQTTWCADVERCFLAADVPAALAQVARSSTLQLAELAALVRAELTPVARLSVASLVTLFVHARDATAALIKCARTARQSTSRAACQQFSVVRAKCNVVWAAGRA